MQGGAARVLFGVLLGGALLLSALVSFPTARAETIGRWTTTPEFEAGTRIETSAVDEDNNFAVETANDNPRVPSGDLWPLTILGDTFENADANADTWRWNRNQGGGGCDGGPVSITGGVLDVDRGEGTVDQGVVTRAQITGAFDIRVTVDEFVAGAASTNAWLALYDTEDDCMNNLAMPGSKEGVTYVWGEGTPDTAFSLIARNYTASSGTVCGTSTILNNTDPIRLRVTRSGDTFTFYYSTVPGEAWILDETCTQANVGDVFVNLGTHGDVGDSAGFRFDDYVATVGEPAADGVIATAEWTATTFDTGTDYLLEASLVGAGSTAAYIDDVQLLAGASGSTVLQSHAGVRKTVNGIQSFPFAEQQGLVRLTFDFESDGASYATISEVVLRADVPTGGTPRPKEPNPRFPCAYRWFSRTFACMNAYNPGIVPGISSVRWELSKDGDLRATGEGLRVVLGTGSPLWDVGVDDYQLKIVVTLGNGMVQTFHSLLRDDDRPWLLVYLVFTFSALVIVNVVRR